MRTGGCQLGAPAPGANDAGLAAAALLGDNNNFELKLGSPQRVGDIVLKLVTTDPKRNKYTVEVSADNTMTEKKNKNINEPVQFYTSKAKQPYELVVNQVRRYMIAGYLTTPKKPKVNSNDGLTYVWIPPGTFTMGCPTRDKECEFDYGNKAHLVTVSRGFWLGQTEVTQEAYQRVMGKNQSRFKGEKLPVEEISWEDARSYCQAVGMRLPSEPEQRKRDARGRGEAAKHMGII